MMRLSSFHWSTTHVLLCIFLTIMMIKLIKFSSFHRHHVPRELIKRIRQEWIRLKTQKDEYSLSETKPRPTCFNFVFTLEMGLIIFENLVPTYYTTTTHNLTSIWPRLLDMLLKQPKKILFGFFYWANNF